MPGYSLAAVDQSRIDEKSLCPKCKGLLKEAVQTIECGHRYCKTCVDALLKWVNMIMDDEVKFNEGENSLREKKHFSTNNQNTLGLRSLAMVAIDPSPLMLSFFFVKTG